MKLRNTIQIFLSPFEYQRSGSGSYFLKKIGRLLIKIFFGFWKFRKKLLREFPVRRQIL